MGTKKRSIFQQHRLNQVKIWQPLRKRLHIFPKLSHSLNPLLTKWKVDLTRKRRAELILKNKRGRLKEILRWHRMPLLTLREQRGKLRVLLQTKKKITNFLLQNWMMSNPLLQRHRRILRNSRAALRHQKRSLRLNVKPVLKLSAKDLILQEKLINSVTDLMKLVVPLLPK